MADVNTDSKAEDIKKNVCDMIDDILGNKKAASVSDSSSNTPEDETNKGEDNKDGENKDSANKPEESKVEDSAAVEQIKTQLADATSKNEALEKELADAKAELEKAQEDLKDSQTEAGELKDKCLALATANKELVADSIIAKELVGGKVTDETKDSRKEELLAMSMKDLNKLSEEAVEDKQQNRTPAHVSNPSLANSDEGDNKDSNSNADTNKKATDSNNTAKKTVDDFAKDIVSKLVR